LFGRLTGRAGTGPWCWLMCVEEVGQWMAGQGVQWKKGGLCGNVWEGPSLSTDMIHTLVYFGRGGGRDTCVEAL
jgi:hypothetical protein